LHNKAKHSYHCQPPCDSQKSRWQTVNSTNAYIFIAKHELRKKLKYRS
jgi:hypothetical protein